MKNKNKTLTLTKTFRKISTLSRILSQCSKSMNNCASKSKIFSWPNKQKTEFSSSKKNKKPSTRKEAYSSSNKMYKPSAEKANKKYKIFSLIGTKPSRTSSMNSRISKAILSNNNKLISMSSRRKSPVRKYPKSSTLPKF